MASQSPELPQRGLSRSVVGGFLQDSFLNYPDVAEKCKPHMARSIHQNDGMKKAVLRQILARNLQAAMETSPGVDTQMTLAKRAGIGQSHISRILRGESAATIDVIAALAEALNIQPWELLANDEATRQAALEKMLGGSPHERAQPLKFPLRHRK
jgi:plasmid maintenance system antidote protein VapI